MTKYMLDVEHIGIISDEMREAVEELWPELAHKLPPDARATRVAPDLDDLFCSGIEIRARRNLDSHGIPHCRRQLLANAVIAARDCVSTCV
jgi:hypothetical protein